MEYHKLIRPIESKNSSQNYDEITKKLHDISIYHSDNNQNLSEYVKLMETIMLRLDERMNDFLSMPFKEQAFSIQCVFDWALRHKKESFDFIQTIADKYKIMLSFSKFEDKLDDFKYEFDEKVKVHDYLIDIVRLAVGLRPGRKESFVFESDTMRSKVREMLEQCFSEIDALHLPKGCNVSILKEKLRRFNNREMYGLEHYINGLFNPLFSKEDVVVWLDSFVDDSMSKVACAPFYYEILYYFKCIPQEKYNEHRYNSAHDIYDLIKRWIPKRKK